MSRLALIIGNSEYQDPNLARLATPGEDVSDLEEVLKDPKIGGFDSVKPLVNRDMAEVSREIARFFNQKKKDDLLLFYFSGHGVKDDNGELYLAARDTERDLLSGTAIPARYIAEQMDRGNSRRVVLILDCCHSGAFQRGAKGADASVGVKSAFEGSSGGSGRVVLTATDAQQYAWEGEEISGDACNSVFTRFMIEGLKSGAADTDGDGKITVDELYDYIFERVQHETGKQSPGKFTYGQYGELLIAQNPNPPPPKMNVLPQELRDALESRLAGVRAGAAKELAILTGSGDKRIAAAATGALKALVDDDSRQVSDAARAALGLTAARVNPPSAEPQSSQPQVFTRPVGPVHAAASADTEPGHPGWSAQRGPADPQAQRAEPRPQPAGRAAQPQVAPAALATGASVGVPLMGMAAAVGGWAVGSAIAAIAFLQHSLAVEALAELAVGAFLGIPAATIIPFVTRQQRTKWWGIMSGAWVLGIPTLGFAGPIATGIGAARMRGRPRAADGWIIGGAWLLMLIITIGAAKAAAREFGPSKAAVFAMIFAVVGGLAGLMGAAVTSWRVKAANTAASAAV